MTEFFEISDFTALKKVLNASTVESCTMLHINIRSLQKYWYQIRIVVESLKSLVDVFVLTEANVPEESLQQFELPGYNAFLRTRPVGREGGIAVFFKER